MMLRLRRSTVEEIDRHAREIYPDECCGAVVAAGDEESVRRITNVQGRLHAEDPQAHPRDARTAYFMEPKELYAVIREAETNGHALRAFYHSHPEHDAYFSAEDEARAMAWDEPAYPDAAWVVISVRGGEVHDRRAYAWDAERRGFMEIPLAIED